VSTYEQIIVDQRDAVLKITLNRPEKMHAWTPKMMGELTSTIQEANDDSAIGAIVVTGAGRGFCAGADLATGTLTGEDRSAAVRRHLQTFYNPIILGIRELEKPVVAAVNGVAAGAGMSLALACDLRICAESASFLQAFVRIGLVPDAGSTYFLPRLVGMARAAELAMLGEQIPAVDALRMGLVNHVVPDEALPDAAGELAARLARGPRSIGLIKRALAAALGNDLRSQLGVEEDLQALALASEDAAEGVAAFLGKRPAEFRGR